MSSIEDYLIVQENGSHTLAQEVLKWIKRGYKPQGGVAVIVGYSARSWMQAMVKETT
jgi:hypothetical protein